MVDPLFNSFATAAFFKFVIFAIFEMRYLLTIWRARRAAVLDPWVAQRELSILYARFYSALLGGIFVTYQLQQCALLHFQCHYLIWDLRHLMVSSYVTNWQHLIVSSLALRSNDAYLQSGLAQDCALIAAFEMSHQYKSALTVVTHGTYIPAVPYPRRDTSSLLLQVHAYHCVPAVQLLGTPDRAVREAGLQTAPCAWTSPSVIPRFPCLCEIPMLHVRFDSSMIVIGV